MKTNVLSKINDFSVIYNETKSPFAVYANEQLVKIQTNSETIITSIKNELDKLLIYTVSELKISTSSLLETLIHNFGVKDVTQKDIQRRLKVLSASEFLDTYRFENRTAQSSNKIYMLGWRGAGFLKSSNSKKLRLGNYLKELDATQTKKILSTTQYLIKSGFDLASFSMCEPVFVPSNKNDGKIFRPQSIVRTGTETVLFIEAVRQNNEWKPDLINKLDRIVAVAQAKKNNIDFVKQNTSLLLIAENTEHMKQIMKLVNSYYIYYPIRIIYSADTLTYAYPENCLYSIKRNILTAFFSA